MGTVDNLKIPRESEKIGLIEILPGTDLRGKDTQETKEVLSETGEETLEGDSGTTREKEGERNILEIGEGTIQGNEEGTIPEIGGKTTLRIGEEKTQGKGTERILEEEKIPMRTNRNRNRITKLPDEQRKILWKRVTRRGMIMTN